MSEQPSIFDGLEGAGLRFVERPAPLKANTHGACPSCLTDKVGLVIQGGHLVWKDHYVSTWGGSSRQCLAGGQRLCDSPARDVHLVTGLSTPVCICTH